MAESRFAELKRKLEKNGWRHARSDGSHRVFTKPGHPRPISIPVVGKGVKGCYVEKAEKIIQKCESGDCPYC